MHDSLDLEALHKQLARVERRLTAIRVIFGFICTLISVAGLLLLFFAPQVPTRCGECLSNLGITVFLLGLVGALLVWSTTVLLRLSSFGNQRQRLELLQNLNLRDVPKPTSATINYRRIIYILFFISLIAAFVAPFVTRNPVIHLATAIIMAIMMLAVLGVLLIPFYLQMRIYQGLLKKGEYETALKEVMSLRRRFPNQAEYINLAGVVLSTMDRGEEAQQAYREYLGFLLRTPHALLVVVALNNLAYEYVMAQHYEDALPLLETAAKIYPRLAQSYHTLALLYLEQNLKPERALELSKVAIKFSSRFQRDAKAAFMATQAWAAALAGHSSDAEDLLNQAFQLVNPKLQPTLAYLHRAAGQAKLASKDIKEAQAHYYTAVKLDPNGRTGHKAQQSLDQMQQNP